MLIWLLVLLIAIAWKYFGCNPIGIAYQESKVIKMSITESERETVLKKIAKYFVREKTKQILFNSERLKSLMISIWLQVVDYQ